MSTALPDAGSPPAAPRAGADLRAARERLSWPVEEMSRGLHPRCRISKRWKKGASICCRAMPMRSGSCEPMRGRWDWIPTRSRVASRPKPAKSTARPNWCSPRRCRSAACQPVPSSCWVPCWQSAPTLAGIVCPATGGCRPRPWRRCPSSLASLARQAAPPAPPSATMPAATPTQPPMGATASAQPPVTVVASPSPLQDRTPADQPVPPVPAISPSSAAAAVPPSAPPAVPAASITSAIDQPRVVLTATADAWVQVRDRNGSVLLNRVLHNGDTWPVPPRPNLLLTTGNAGSTQLVVDGRGHAGSGRTRCGAS